MRRIRKIAGEFDSSYLSKEWDESKHPRAADGKFGEGSGKSPKEKPAEGTFSQSHVVTIPGLNKPHNFISGLLSNEDIKSIGETNAKKAATLLDKESAANLKGAKQQKQYADDTNNDLDEMDDEQDEVGYSDTEFHELEEEALKFEEQADILEMVSTRQKTAADAIKAYYKL